ncbi:alpha-L-arabinofuranosidase C-terminal domain-containing protein [Leadbetterella byssophila]|uniref:alpha-L-arabinofuranosidase C-terminal domain-containing protein n=1 Tax=Leadbetterella byssophila TaxID=316068 RepID=UPI0039A137EA
MRIIPFFLLILSAFSAVAKVDSLYLFAYGTAKNDYHNGLHYAWSQDQENWIPIGPEYSFLRSDYGRWGSQKKMYHPYLFRSEGGNWHCVWSLNEEDGAIGFASSADLVYWGRQFYPVLSPGKAISKPVLTSKGVYWTTNDHNLYFSEGSAPHFGATKKVETILDLRQERTVMGMKELGTVHKISRAEWEKLVDAFRIAEAKRVQNEERIGVASDRFKGPMKVSIHPDWNKGKAISDMLIGVFFEDINYAADGGLYAELIQNRDFEYRPSDKEDRDPSWNAKKAWNADGLTFTIDSVRPIHKNNAPYAKLQVNRVGGRLINEGFGGIVLKKGEKYLFSAKVRSSTAGRVKVRLVNEQGDVLAEGVSENANKEWKTLKLTLSALENSSNARLELIPLKAGRWDLDMISLFPEKTFKGHGLREDLAQAIADLKPKFVRFPGGCVAHGDGINNIYRWENTIGPWEERKPLRNLWGYHQTMGLGYFEYFQFCEDIGAEPVPVVAAGVPCQNSAHHGCDIGGQQGGIPMEHMDEYVQSILNLIEYANGAINTPYGKKRAEAGHPEPFGLKYLGIGNEDLITDIFEERFRLIYNAVKAKYPDIILIGTVGPFNEGTDYVEGWKLADQMKLEIVDEHYYQTPGWYLNNQHFYDSYDRKGAKVYLGEYAAHIPGRHNNLETALSEALHLINVERNADVVHMTSYAPLLAKEGYTQWNPDLIYFNNTEVKPTVGYEVQKLFGQNSGTKYYPLAISGAFDVRKLAASLVADQDNLILKIVNLHPIEADVDLSWIKHAEVEKTVFSGDLDDKTVKPVSSISEVPSKLAPYSLTILKFKNK